MGMNSDIKAKWLTALRSGEYIQGYGKLKRGKGKLATYCCLGVLCDIIDPTKWIGYDSGEAWYEGSPTGLSSVMMERIGMDSSHQGPLQSMNDALGLSFAAIADHIEKNL